MTKPAMPERDSVITSETDINATAMRTNCTAPPSGDDSHSTALRHPEAGRRLARAVHPSPSPIASGRPIRIQPAKWFLFTNGPKGVVKRYLGFQNP